ncbi:core-2/I-branching enzyme-domain-containing protein [Zopfochytrium polystomum]|nr:core-2/I-branching enzyme-domain-containing protein [Zopfochytrium polystomum]
MFKKTSAAAAAATAAIFGTSGRPRGSRSLFSLAAVLLILLMIGVLIPGPVPDFRDGDNYQMNSPPSLPMLAVMSNPDSNRPRFERVSGFSFCHILENATIDTTAFIIPWRETVAERRATVDEVVQLIDSTARSLHRDILEKHELVEPLDTFRFACYSAGEGSNPAAKLSRSPLIRSLDPLHYHADVLPALKESIPRTESKRRSRHHPRQQRKRRRYRIAYLIMIHGDTESTFANTKALIDELDDGTAVFLVHVDLGFPELYDRVCGWVADRDRYVAERFRTQRASASNATGGELPTAGNATAESHGENDYNDVVHSNVFIAQHRYRGMWGHISLVWMQLSGFWELFDIAEWDAVINLSAADFPLRRSREIHRLLSKQSNRGKNFIGHWSAPMDLAERIYRPHLPRTDRPSVEFSMTEITHTMGLRSPPFPEWTWCKHHQWMILTRDLVKFLRADLVALHVLAFMEHSWIPDELFFCAVANNRPQLSATVISSSKRFVEFGGMIHPYYLDLRWTDRFPEDAQVGVEPAYFFVRKVLQFDGSMESTEPSGGRQLANWIREKHLNRHLVPEGYGKIECEAWVG